MFPEKNMLLYSGRCQRQCRVLFSRNSSIVGAVGGPALVDASTWEPFQSPEKNEDTADQSAPFYQSFYWNSPLIIFVVTVLGLHIFIMASLYFFGSLGSFFPLW